MKFSSRFILVFGLVTFIPALSFAEETKESSAKSPNGRKILVFEQMATEYDCARTSLVGVLSFEDARKFPEFWDVISKPKSRADETIIKLRQVRNGVVEVDQQIDRVGLAQSTLAELIANSHTKPDLKVKSAEIKTPDAKKPVVTPVQSIDVTEVTAQIDALVELQKKLKEAKNPKAALPEQLAIESKLDDAIINAQSMVSTLRAFTNQNLERVRHEEKLTETLWPNLAIDRKLAASKATEKKLHSVLVRLYPEIKDAEKIQAEIEESRKELKQAE